MSERDAVDDFLRMAVDASDGGGTFGREIENVILDKESVGIGGQSAGGMRLERDGRKRRLSMRAEEI